MLKKKALVVDGNYLICWALEKELAGLGLSVRVVQNGANALSELRDRSYDIVFLEVRLPDVDGATVLGEIGRVAPETTVVIMSGDASSANRDGAFGGGALQFLEKPFSLSEIQSILKSTLGDHSNNRRHPRFICRLPLRISIMEPAPEESQYDLNNLNCVAADFGFGGIRLHTEYPLRVAQRVRTRASAESTHFRQILPEDSIATVVWVAQAPEGVIAGLQFLNDPSPARTS